MIIHLLVKCNGNVSQTGWRTYRRPDEKSGGHGVGWSPIIPYAFSVPQDWNEVLLDSVLLSLVFLCNWFKSCFETLTYRYLYRSLILVAPRLT